MSKKSKSNQNDENQQNPIMQQFKMEAAEEVGVTLNDGDNGNLTTREAGSIGGQMVKNMIEKAKGSNS